MVSRPSSPILALLASFSSRRAVRFNHPPLFDVGCVLSRLRDSYPECLACGYPWPPLASSHYVHALPFLCATPYNGVADTEPVSVKPAVAHVGIRLHTSLTAVVHAGPGRRCMNDRPVEELFDASATRGLHAATYTWPCYASFPFPRIQARYTRYTCPSLTFVFSLFF